MCVSGHWAVSSCRTAAGTKEPSRSHRFKAACDIIIARSWHGSNPRVRGEMEMKKWGPSTWKKKPGERGPKGLNLESKRERERETAGAVRTMEGGQRAGLGAESSVVLCSSGQGCARLCMAQYWPFSPNGHSYDTSDVSQPLLFSSLWRRHTEWRDNEVQSSSGKKGQL